jgi:fumarate hydratase subunit beta
MPAGIRKRFYDDVEELMTEFKRMSAPLTDAIVENLRAGDNVLISGTIYTGRDAAHKRLIDLVQKNEEFPFDIRGQIIYYAGPSPTKPGAIIGSAGPTTSGRMDAYAPALLERGLRGMIGKGSRNQQVKDSIKKYKGVYMAATGGAAALITKSIKAMRIVAYEELGPEAICALEVVDFPIVVVNDIYGNDLYEMGRKQFEIK